MISYAANRRIYGQWQSALPSRFIGELPADMIETSVAQGLYGSAAPAGRGPAFDIETVPFRGFRQPPGGRVIDVPVEGREIRKIGGFKPGDRVFHQKFGGGTVREIDDNKLVIDFDHAGEKKVMDSFVDKA
jgi:DNA helicase-2/ATP-dependent DNA helicase PcrA